MMAHMLVTRMADRSGPWSGLRSGPLSEVLLAYL